MSRPSAFESKASHSVADNDPKGEKGGTLYRLSISASVDFSYGLEDSASADREASLKSLLAEIERKARETFEYVDSNILVSDPDGLVSRRKPKA